MQDASLYTGVDGYDAIATVEDAVVARLSNDPTLNKYLVGQRDAKRCSVAFIPAKRGQQFKQYAAQ